MIACSASDDDVAVEGWHVRYELLLCCLRELVGVSVVEADMPVVSGELCCRCWLWGREVG